MRRFPALALLAAGSIAAMAGTESLSIAEMPLPAKLQPARVIESKPFGEKFAGRALWLSANGRYAAMFRLTEDTDKNGKLNIDFGMHGDSWGDELALDVIDIDTDKHERFDDLLIGDPMRRYIVLTRGNETLLFDSVSGKTRNLRDLGGGAASDGNLCMTPRQIAFDGAGEQFALLRDQPAELVLYTTASESSRVIYRPDKPLWRIGFTAAPSWLIATETSGEFPRQSGSCVSRSRSAFAASYSTNGLDPHSISYAFIGNDGQRLAVGEAPVVLSDTVYALPTGPQLQRFDGARIPVPDGCKIVDGGDGSRVVVLECGTTTELFDPASGLRRALPPGQSLTFIDGTRTVSRDGTWYAIRFPIKGATDDSDIQMHLGRMRLEDLRLERGPPVYFLRHSSNQGWLVGGHNDEFYMLNVASGASYTEHAKDTQTGSGELSLRTGKHSFLLLDPEHDQRAEWKREVGISNGQGCYIVASGQRTAGMTNIDAGPWTRICVAALPQDSPSKSSIQ